MKSSNSKAVMFEPTPGDPFTVIVPSAENEIDFAKRYVVCAANRAEDGRIFIGIRHFDDVMRQAMKDAGYKPAQVQEQGFVDQWGNFMDRKEAMKIAVARVQIRRSIGYDSDELYSEHLY